MRDSILLSVKLYCGVLWRWLHARSGVTPRGSAGREAYAAQQKILFVETSAKAGLNIKALFRQVTITIAVSFSCACPLEDGAALAMPQSIRRLAPPQHVVTT